jgi:hypothetical protein
MVVFPLIFFVTLAFLFSNSLEDVIQWQTIMNCPFPVNSAIATLNTTQYPPQVAYSTVFDNDTGSYHVTTFECEYDSTSSGASVNTRVYTGSDAWYDVTGRASGYMFYISEYVSTIGTRVNAFFNSAWLFIDAPAQVTGLSFFSYIQTSLLFMIGFGMFLAVRGST